MQGPMFPEPAPREQLIWPGSLADRQAAQQAQAADQEAAAERRARWQRWQETLDPNSPTARWRDLTLGAECTVRLRAQWLDVESPPEWFV